MPVPFPTLTRGQFDLTWSLFEYHLERLEPEDFRWEPAPLCWTMRGGPAGGWVPDWADTEPDPVPVPTIAWLTWHLGWWWSVTMDHLQGRPPRERSDIASRPTCSACRRQMVVEGSELGHGQVGRVGPLRLAEDLRRRQAGVGA
ncbi:DinB superfamily protein [Micromonospora inyonensis]|uniref:DinB superfamily protein n=1 Tax=Micromonospora inyonensis TaxID=47866 RepID=A0A1C6RJJ8_9ACTN|nr:DinB superfamily protein [Micromonospora inyonensis]